MYGKKNPKIVNGGKSYRLVSGIQTGYCIF